MIIGLEKSAISAGHAASYTSNDVPAGNTCINNIYYSVFRKFCIGPGWQSGNASHSYNTCNEKIRGSIPRLGFDFFALFAAPTKVSGRSVIRGNEDAVEFSNDF